MSSIAPTTGFKNGALPQPRATAHRLAASATTAWSARPRRMSLLEVSHLRKSFGNLVAVDDLSFHVEVGEIFGLVGPNGAGKSTTMMIIAGTRRPDSGTVVIAGQLAGEGIRTAQRMLGVVPQDLAIY